MFSSYFAFSSGNTTITKTPVSGPPTPRALLSFSNLALEKGGTCSMSLGLDLLLHVTVFLFHSQVCCLLLLLHLQLLLVPPFPKFKPSQKSYKNTNAKEATALSYRFLSWASNSWFFPWILQKSCGYSYILFSTGWRSAYLPSLVLRACCLMSSSIKDSPGLQRAVALRFGARPEPVSSELKQPHLVTERCLPMMARALMRFLRCAHILHFVLFHFNWKLRRRFMLHKHSVIFRSIYHTGKLNKQVDNGPADFIAFLIHISPISCPAHRFSSLWFSVVLIFFILPLFLSLLF